MGAQLPLYSLKSFLGQKKLKNLKLILTKKWSTYFSTRHDSSKSTFILQNSIHKASASPPKFWHICIFPSRQANAKIAKEPKFTSRTAPAKTIAGQYMYSASAITQTNSTISKTTKALSSTNLQLQKFVK